jgi:hypothetical protein
MSFTVTHPIGRVPTYAELQDLAGQFGVEIIDSDLKGEFTHPKATGKYTFEKAGELHGDFAGHHVLGQITGIFVIMTGNAEITITQKPFLMPEALLRSEILNQSTVFCAKFPPLA